MASAGNPTLAQIKRVNDAMLPQDSPLVEGPHEYRGWTVRIYNAPGFSGEFLCCADRLTADGKAEKAEDYAATMDAVRAWMRAMPNRVAQQAAA